MKTTNDLLVLRSDCYRLEESHHLALEDTVSSVPFVDLDTDFYKRVRDFDQRFPEGVPSLKEASSLRVEGDWTFGAGVVVVGDVRIGPEGAPGRL